VAIGMARRSNLEGRLLAVLDEARARGVIPSRASVTTLAVAMLLLLPVTGLEPRFTTAEAKGRPHGTVAQATPREDALTADEGAPEHGVRDPGSDDAGDGSPVSEKSLSATPGGLLELDLETGGAVEIQGWDRREVSVRSRLAGSDWRGSRVEVTSRANGVRVHCFQADRATSYTTSHEFQIRVPSAYDVRLRSAGGDVAIADVSGSFRGSTGGGHLQLERDRGQANLTTGGGDIEVSDSHLAGAVMTGGGTVRLSRVRGGLRGSSGSGPVVYSEDEKTGGSTEDDATGDLDGVRVDGEHERIRVGDDGAGFLHIHKAGGGVDLDDAPSGAEIRTGGGAVRVRHGRGSLSAHTGGGDIEIGPIAGSVSAGTGAGDVHVILASIGGDQQSVDIWSGTGNVVVELPEDLNARFEVETAFTESFRRQARITSEWSLERDAITGWDDSQGTRRRHVRARGLAGDGKGLIRIKTVNGDIQLRRVAARATER